MSDFVEFSAAVGRNFTALSRNELFLADDPQLWEAYLEAFPEGTNPIYRTRTAHDCACCRQFIKTIGRAVAIADDGSLTTIWSVPDLPEPYATVAATLDERVRNAAIANLFRTKEPRYGAAVTLERLDDGSVHTWDHFVGHVASQHMSNAAGTAMGEARTNQDVLFRSLSEVSLSALDTVRDMIAEGQLYRGSEFLPALTAFRALRQTFDTILPERRRTWAWRQAAAKPSLCSFKNTVIGSLVWDISTGMDLEDAVRMFESKVAPQNYKRPTAVVTQSMVNAAMAKINDLGVESALYRRHARLSDVSVADVLFVDNDVRSKMRGGIETLLTAAVVPQAIDASRATEISIEDFLANEVPKATSMKLLVKNRHLGNFVSMTAPVYPDAKPLFRWDNNFAWSYDGDAADSIKTRVKRAGGRVDAKFRISLAWRNTDDLDLHVYTPSGEHIFYGQKQSRCGGRLDVDMNVCDPVRDAVENIYWRYYVTPGTYMVHVNNFTKRESIDVGFDLEVEYNGVVRQFTCPRSPENQTAMQALSIDIAPYGVLAGIHAHAPVTDGTTAVTKWGITTQQLIPVDLLTLSPNHWGANTAGAKHWIFALRNCKSPDKVRGIYNEFLRPSLAEHRRVFELLGAKTKCEPAEDQISGLGFTSARNDSAVVVVSGAKGSRVFNVKF